MTTVLSETIVVDLGTTPAPPYEYWTISENEQGGDWVFDSSKLVLYRSWEQEADQPIRGLKLLRKVRLRKKGNQALLQFFRDNPIHVPEDWKIVLFPGTTIQDSDENEYWQTLYYDDNGDIQSGLMPLDSTIPAHVPVVLFKE